MHYLYCFTEDLKPPHAGFCGIQGEAVHSWNSGGLSIWLSSVSPSEALITEQNAVCHAAIVERVQELADPVVPCRFGTLVKSPEAGLELLKMHREQLSKEMSRFRNKREISVRILLEASQTEGTQTHANTNAHAQAPAHAPATHPPAPPDPYPGGDLSPGSPQTPRALLPREYLLAKQGARDARLRLLAEGKRLGCRLSEQLAGFSTENRCQEKLLPNGILCSLFYLVPFPDIPNFLETVREFERHMVPARIHSSGPWPPYSFVKELGKEGKL